MGHGAVFAAVRVHIFAGGNYLEVTPSLAGESQRLRDGCSLAVGEKIEKLIALLRKD
jgi:hypothetical protein